MKILSLSSLMPNTAQPAHGVFLKHRLLHLAADDPASVEAVAPVPWFPFSQEKFGRYANYSRVPHHEIHGRISVWHPRFVTVPKLGAAWAPYAIAAALVPLLARLKREGFDFDVIDSYYLYPDGVAAALLSAFFQRPFVMTAFGSDVSLIADLPLPGAQIRWAMRRAHGLTAVCDALRRRMIEIEPAATGTEVVLHGVDHALFQPPLDRDEARRRLGFTGQTLISVGSLIPRKGHHIAISALQGLPDTRLAIAGAGPLERQLRAQAEREGVANRVVFLGELPQPALCAAMGAADALVLCSDREGIANVLMEANACGTPAIATPVWGSPEVICAAEAGLLMRDRSPEALVAAVRQFSTQSLDRAATRRHALRFDWSMTARRHHTVLERAVRAWHRQPVHQSLPLHRMDEERP
jgi:glycosyltransferase involved in cell wall biosynthesis